MVETNVAQVNCTSKVGEMSQQKGGSPRRKKPLTLREHHARMTSLIRGLAISKLLKWDKIIPILSHFFYFFMERI